MQRPCLALSGHDGSLSSDDVSFDFSTSGQQMDHERHQWQVLGESPVNVDVDWREVAGLFHTRCSAARSAGGGCGLLVMDDSSAARRW